MTHVVSPCEPGVPDLRPVALDDRWRLPWRFLARHMALDALSPVR